MARALDATQSELVRRSHIAPVTLVKLTTFTNRTTETVDKIFYLSNLPVRYDYGNLGTDRDFLPVITGGGQFVSGFQHVPEPENLTAFGQALDLEVSNLPIGGKPFVLILQQHNLEGAKIEISQLLLPEIAAVPLDLSTSHVGDEHTVLFRGRINRIAPIQEFNFTIQCRADLPGMANEWIYASDDTKVDPRDIGKRVPRAYGFAKHVPVIAWEVGAEGTLSEAIDATEDDVDIFVDTTARLPDSPTEFTLRIDLEEITCTKASPTQIHIELGGRTVPAAHTIGAPWTEVITLNTWILSDKESDVIPNLYQVDPITNALVRIEENSLVKNLADTVTIPGRTVTSLTLAAAEGFEQWGDQAVGGPEVARYHLAENRDVLSAGSTFIEMSSGDMAMRFDNIGFGNNDDRPGIVYTVYITKGPLGLVNDIEILINGSLNVGDITPGQVPSQGSVPGAISFTFDQALLTSGGSRHTIELRIASGDSVRYFGWKRLWTQHQSAPGFPTFDEADSVTGNITGLMQADYDKVNDGNDATFISFTGTDNEEIVCTFPTHPSETRYDMQIDVLMKVNGVIFWVLETLPSDEDIIINNSTFRGAITPEEHFIYDKHEGGFPDNDIRLRTTQSSDFGDIHSITRTIHKIERVPQAPKQQLFADIDGVVAPDGTYDAAVGDVLIHPADIIKHWIEEVGGETVDGPSYDALVTSLGAAAEWGFDARGLGFTWAEVLARMAYEARCNVIPVETASGRVWKLLAADNGYGFGAPPSGSIIGSVEGLIDEGRAIDDLGSFFTFRYKYDAGLFAGGNEEAFTEILLATPDVTDVPITTTILSDAADRFGDIEAQPINYRATQDKATAQDTSGYLVQERIANKRRVFRIGNVPWFDALPRDVGDIVSVTPPWDTVAVTCRIIEMRKGFDSNSWDLTAIEVLETGTRT